MNAPSASRVTKPPKALNSERFVPPFENGDKMDQKTFHELYKQTPEGFKAELIGGYVHMASPVKLASHADPHGRMAGWLFNNRARTPGTGFGDNATNILDEANEPQPDLTMYIRAEAGGQSEISADDYLVGPAELLVEIANSSVSIDRNAKFLNYERAGVLEYLIVIVQNQEVEWYTRVRDRFEALKQDAAGLLKSRVFPGLWLDPTAIFDDEPTRLLDVLNAGLASPEHAKFVKKLQK